MLGIYCRISREKEEGKDRSINDQQKLGIEKAKELGETYKVYIDAGVSGTLDIEKRPAFSNLIDDILNLEITSVYVFDQSRIERNPEVRFTILKILKENGIKLYTSSGEVDLFDSEAEMMGNIMSVMNQYYVTITKKKIKSVLRRNIEEGKVHSVPAYGYKKDENGFLVIDEKESDLIERIYNDSLNGVGTNKIAENLNKEGVLTRYNKIGKGTLRIKNKYTNKITYKNKTDIKWSGNTIRSIITNQIYKGVRIFSGEEYKSPIIIEVGLWQKVNDNLPKNRNNSGKKVDHKYLLKGMLECGFCGKNMYGRTRTNKKDHYYMCSSKRYKDLNCGNRSVNIDFIERYIWEVVLDDYHVVNDLKKVNPDDNKIKDLSEKEVQIKSEINSIKKEITKINQLAIKGVLDIEEAKKEKENRNSILEDKRKILKNTNEEMEFELNAIQLRKTIGIDIDKVRADTPYNKKKELLFKYISRVYIKYNKNIRHYYLTVRFKTNTIEQNYAFSSSPHKMKRFINTGEVEQSDEEKEKIIENLEIDIDEKDYETIRSSRSKR
jgi:site-specific DNA recombinase